MSLSFHVSGTSTISVDGSPLGICVDGIEVEMQNYAEDIYADTQFGGPKTPSDVQTMGGIAMVKLELIDYDLAVLTSVISAFSGTAEGSVAPSGKLFLQQSGTHTLAITVANITGSEKNYSFGKAYLQDVASWKVGVRRTVYQLTFRCLPNSGVIYTTS